MNDLRQIYTPIFYCISVFIVLFISSCKSPVPFNHESIDDSTHSVKLDSSIRYGQLPNGFTYFIKDLSEPQPKLYMRFHHNAGTNQQDADQIDVAHGLEHLAFKPTKHFPNGIDQSKSIKTLGISIYDMLAFSGQTTVYYFDAPLQSQEALETGFSFFKDIANGLNLTDEAIHSVKGELKQEHFFRQGDNLNKNNAESKLEASYFPCKQDESNYLDRIENQTPEDFRRFYRDWYRPDLLAISIVGNIEDIDSLEKLIKNTFSDLESPANTKKIMDCDSLFANRAPQFSIIERTPVISKMVPDKEVDLDIIFRDPITMKNLNNINGLKRLILMQMLRDIVSERLREISTGYGSFIAGIRDTYESDNLPSTIKIGAMLESSIGEKKTLQQILRVLRQLQLFGVSRAEWDNLKEKHLQYLKDKDVNNAKYWIKEIQNFYTKGEALPDNKNAMRKAWLSDLSLSEFNDFGSQFLSKKPEDIGIMAPNGHKALLYTEQEVRAWVEDIYQEEVQVYQKPFVPDVLMSSKELNKLKKPEITENSSYKTGVREVILNNGVKLVFKQINGAVGLDKDNIRIHGYALKGADCFPKEQFFSAVYAPSIIGYTGLNGMNRFEIERFLKKKKMLSGGVSTYIDRDEVGIQGSTDVSNLEIILQLMYLNFISPNKNKEAFEDWKMMKFRTYKYQSNFEFRKAIRKSTGDLSVIANVFGSNGLSEGNDFFEGIAKIDLDEAHEIFNKLFSNSEDFTFVISGDFQIEFVLPMVNKYFGNLPNTSSTLTCDFSNKEKLFVPDGPNFQEITAPITEKLNYMKYHNSFLQTAPIQLDWKEQLRVEALGWITTKKAWRLRYELGLALYDVEVRGTFNKKMNRYEINSTFECVPEEYPVIRKEVKDIIFEIKSGLITEGLFEQGMFVMHHYYDLDKGGGKHRSQHENLYDHYRYGQPLIDPKEVEEFVNSLTVEDIVKTANKYYKDENLYEFVMIDKELCR